MTKKLLFGIVVLFVGFIGFSCAEVSIVDYNGQTVLSDSNYNFSSYGCFRGANNNCSRNFDLYSSDGTLLISSGNNYNNLQFFCGIEPGMYLHNYYNSNCTYYIYSDLYYGNSSFPSSSDISVFYNGYNNVQSFICDGDTSIYLDGNFNFIQSNNLFTPYFNIHYTDGDNQVLTGEYEKTDLFLDGQYDKLYTGGSNNYWVLTPIESPDLNIISYQPTFDVEFTGDIIDTGNIFNNFAENSLKFTLSNVPNYIQYVIIIMLLFFILGFIRKFKRK